MLLEVVGMSRPRLAWLYNDEFHRIDGLHQSLESFASVDSYDGGRDTLLNTVSEYEILVPPLNEKIDKEIIDRGIRLRIIGTPTTGTDHIDVAYAQSVGIKIVSIKDDRAFLDNVQATAELAWLLILACNRNFRAAIDDVLGGGWNRSAVRGHDLMDRTLGIVGYGRLGRMVSRMARAFRMKVMGCDPKAISDRWVEQVSLETLLGCADIVTLHVHLDEDTLGLIGREQLARIKRGSYLVNTARGELVDEGALLDALREGRLAGAGLDVVQRELEPIRGERPLLKYAAKHKNLIITPHIGGCTEESQEKAFIFFAEKLGRAVRGLDDDDS